MLTYSGVHVTPATAEAPAPVDLAVQMSRLCQFGGSVWFTLLSHSVFVAELLWGEPDRKPAPSKLQTWAWALLHDAHKVVTGDIPRPWKSDDMKKRQRDLDARILKRYKIQKKDVDFKAIDKVDKRATIVQGILLNLKGFKEVISGNGEQKTFEKPSQSEACTFWRIVSRRLNDAAMCETPSMRMVERIKKVFEQIEAGLVLEARNSVERILYQ